MAFAYTITNRMLMPPAQKRSPDSGNIYFEWGEFTNGSGDTGGAITTTGTRVLIAGAEHESATPAAIQVQRNQASDGQITITTADNADGFWWAVVKE